MILTKNIKPGNKTTIYLGLINKRQRFYFHNVPASSRKLNDPHDWAKSLQLAFLGHRKP